MYLQLVKIMGETPFCAVVDFQLLSDTTCHKSMSKNLCYSPLRNTIETGEVRIRVHMCQAVELFMLG